jgi:hypothetical protein
MVRQLALLTAVLVGGNSALGQGDAAKPPATSEKVACKCTGFDGALLQRTKPGQPWQAVRSNDEIKSGTLLIALPEAQLTSPNGAVKLRMIADLGRRLPEPVFEAAVILNDPGTADLDFTLDRGIVALRNEKKAGEARVKLRFEGQAWDLTLKEPGTTVLTGIFGRHPPGIRDFNKDKSKPFHAGQPPTEEVHILVTQGKAEIHTGEKQFGLQAPPGFAKLHWDNVIGADEVPTRLEELPDIVRPRTAEEQQHAKEICSRCAPFNNKPLSQVLEELYKSDDLSNRKLAVVSFGALDDLPRLFGALSNPDPGIRDLAVIVLRHWLGRADHHDEALYEYVRKLPNDQFSEADAKMLLQLLYGLNEEERSLPEVYTALIASLRHQDLPIRELARWHLYRLVPAGKDIPYDAAASPELREKAAKQWKALIPPGELPPRTKVEGSKP